AQLIVTASGPLAEFRAAGCAAGNPWGAAGGDERRRRELLDALVRQTGHPAARLWREAISAAQGILTEHEDALLRLAGALLKERQLTGPEASSILEGIATWRY